MGQISHDMLWGRPMRLLVLVILLLGLAVSPEAKIAAPGIHHTAAGPAKGAQADWRSCLPEGVSKAQVREAVQAWLTLYPKYRDVAISALVAKLEDWLGKHPEFRDAAVSALIEKAHAWLGKHPQYRSVPAAALMAQDLAEGLPCK
jgi:hypothetical protein